MCCTPPPAALRARPDGGGAACCSVARGDWNQQPQECRLFFFLISPPLAPNSQTRRPHPRRPSASLHDPRLFTGSPGPNPNLKAPEQKIRFPPGASVSSPGGRRPGPLFAQRRATRGPRPLAALSNICFTAGRLILRSQVYNRSVCKQPPGGGATHCFSRVERRP